MCLFCCKRRYILIALCNSILGQNLYFCLNHPIKWVRLVGVIVAVDVYPTRWIFLLDDSTGASLEITCGRPVLDNKDVVPTTPAIGTHRPLDPPAQGLTATSRNIDLEGVDVGTVVKVKGGIGSFRGVKQLLLERISILRSTNEEAASWAENAAFRKEVLNVPWTISKKHAERARKRAEGLHQEPKAKEERRQPQAVGVRAQNKRCVSRGECGANKCQEEKDQKLGITDANMEKIQNQKLKRVEEKRLRKQEFERLKMQKEILKPVEEEHGVSNRPPKQDQLPVIEAEKDEGNIRAELLMRKKEQAQERRAEERQLRELEFERLKRLHADEQAERVVTAIVRR